VLPAKGGDRLTEEDKLQSLADIASEADKLQEIIENLLLLTRLEAGQMDLEPVVLPQLIEESIADFLKRHPERPVSFQAAPQLQPAQGEATLVSLVLRNLLSNAAKYTDPGGEIHLSAEKADGTVAIRVRDTGIGIEPTTPIARTTPCRRSEARAG